MIRAWIFGALLWFLFAWVVSTETAGNWKAGLGVALAIPAGAVFMIAVVWGLWWLAGAIAWTV